MGRYARKTARQSWSKDAMREAMRAIENHEISVNAASKQFCIPEATLRRYVKKYGDKNFPQNAGRFKSTFTDEQLLQLKNYIVEIDQSAFGLTKKQFCKIVYSYTEYHGIEHRFNLDKKRAGREFCENFIKKFNLSLRAPESTSIARLIAFNKENIDKFFKTLKELRLKYNYTANQIYNCDETGISTVPTKNPKILTPRGKRRVIKISSAERATNVTALCCISAVGTFVPPLLIFPRVRMQPAYMNGAPPGAIGVAHETGWMTSGNFVKYLQHFIQYVKPSKDNHILLLMDNHATHVTLDAINLCRENNITLLGFPAHTSHRMQPLDVSFFGPLKTAYSVVCENFLISNPGKTITLHDIAHLFGQAYFKACGVEPFDSNIFSEVDFMASKTTERPDDTHEILNPTTVLQPIENRPDGGHNHFNEDQPCISNELESHEKQHLTPPSAENKTGLPSFPVAEVKNKRQRKKLPSLIISSTPVKTSLEAKEQEKMEKERKKRLRQLNKEEKLRNSKLKQANQRIKTQTIKRKVNFSSSSESSCEVEMIDTEDEMDMSSEDYRNCIICDDAGKHKELWYQCAKCREWAHAECTGLNVKEAKAKQAVLRFLSVVDDKLFIS